MKDSHCVRLENDKNFKIKNTFQSEFDRIRMEFKPIIFRGLCKMVQFGQAKTQSHCYSGGYMQYIYIISCYSHNHAICRQVNNPQCSQHRCCCCCDVESLRRWQLQKCFQNDGDGLVHLF